MTHPERETGGLYAEEFSAAEIDQMKREMAADLMRQKSKTEGTSNDG